MACMHKETYQVYHNDQHIVPEGYVELDDLIAPAIVVLNQKGYTTTFCCSGHPFSQWLMRTQEGYEEHRGPMWESYISFVDVIRLPSLPNGFTLDEFFVEKFGRTVIRREYPVTNAEEAQFFKKAQRVLDAMKELYQWALELPEYDGNN